MFSRAHTYLDACLEGESVQNLDLNPSSLLVCGNVFFCNIAFSLQICNRLCWGGMQHGGLSYGPALGVSWVYLFCVVLCCNFQSENPQYSETCCHIVRGCSVGLVTPETMDSNYWKYWVGSGKLATCCG